MMKHDPRIEAIVKTQSTIEGLVHPAISACLADCYFVEIDVLVMFWIIKIDSILLFPEAICLQEFFKQ